MRENENYEDAATSHGGTAVGIASMTTEVVSLVPPSNNGDLRNHPLKEPEPACLSRVMPELRLIPAVAPDWAGEIKRIWAEGGANTLQLAKIAAWPGSNWHGASGPSSGAQVRFRFPRARPTC